MYYGAIGSGKTFLCASYRRVAWFGSTRENGHITIQFMDPSSWYEPDRPPKMYSVSNTAELWAHLKNDIPPKIKAREVMTIVIELTFIAEDYIGSMEKQFEGNGWALYKGLANTMRALDDYGRRMGVQIAYNALAADAQDMSKTPSGILLPGKAIARELPALTDVCGYMRQDEEGDRLLHLQTYGPFPARHRFGKLLPPMIRNPTYRIIEKLLQGKAECDDKGNVTIKEEKKVVAVSAPKTLPTLGKPSSVSVSSNTSNTGNKNK